MIVIGPLNSLLHSRKFLLLLLDMAISLTMYFVTKYASPAALDDIKFVIAIMQPVFLTLIYAIATEDAAALRAGIVPPGQVTEAEPGGATL